MNFSDKLFAFVFKRASRLARKTNFYLTGNLLKTVSSPLRHIVWTILLPVFGSILSVSPSALKSIVNQWFVAIGFERIPDIFTSLWFWLVLFVAGVFFQWVHHYYKPVLPVSIPNRLRPSARVGFPSGKLTNQTTWSIEIESKDKKLQDVGLELRVLEILSPNCDRHRTGIGSHHLNTQAITLGQTGKQVFRLFSIETMPAPSNGWALDTMHFESESKKVLGKERLYELRYHFTASGYKPLVKVFYVENSDNPPLVQMRKPSHWPKEFKESIMF